MGAYWLLNLPTWLRDAGLNVDTWPGWETRSRSTGGYDQVWGICVHHTASNTQPDNDMAYMWNNSPDRPVGAMYLARDGKITVGAAGATNCQGRGGPYPTSKGTIPLDQGNKYMVAIEAANDGTGEPWPQAQQDAYVAMCNVLVNKLGLSVGDIAAHFEWSPGRKADPAGPSQWENGTGMPVFSTRLWDMDAFRGSVWAFDPGDLPTPEPYDPPEDWGDYPSNMSKPSQSDGDAGAFTSYVQDVIWFEAGGGITRDGRFGPETTGRVKDLQRVAGFPEEYVDGIVGWDGGTGDNPGEFATWPLLDALATPAPVDPEPPVEPPTDPDGCTTAVQGDGAWSLMKRVGIDPRGDEAIAWYEHNFRVYPGEVYCRPDA